MRQLYRGYNFRGARDLLEGRDNLPGILSAMKQQPDTGIAERLYKDEDIEKASRLARLLELYEAWDNGDYVAAKRIADDMASIAAGLVPAAVVALGDVWPSAEGIGNAGDAARQLLNQHLQLKQGDQQPEASLFNQPALLLTYACDELHKIKRLISSKEDYRSAFLRAAGLHEWLLKARLALCWLNNAMELWNRETLVGQVAQLSQSDQHKWFKRLVKVRSANAMRKTLQRTDELEIKRNYTVRCIQNAPMLELYWTGKELDLDKLQDGDGNPLLFQLRNEAIHTHLSIPRPVAVAAFDLLKAALDEFERNWLGHWYPDVLGMERVIGLNAPAWSEVCKRIGLDFLPPELRT